MNKPPHVLQPENGECPTPDLCPLNQVRVGTAVKVRRLSAPPEISKRLRELGLVEEQQIRLVNHQHNLICQVCNARLAISAELAARILVEPMPAPALAK